MHDSPSKEVAALQCIHIQGSVCPLSQCGLHLMLDVGVVHPVPEPVGICGAVAARAPEVDVGRGVGAVENINLRGE